MTWFEELRREFRTRMEPIRRAYAEQEIERGRKDEARRARIVEALERAGAEGRTGWQLVRELSPRIRRATLYRDLSRMALKGEITRILTPRDPAEGWPGPPHQRFYANEYAFRQSVV